MESISWDVMIIVFRGASHKPGYVSSLKSTLIPIESATFTSQNPNVMTKVVYPKGIEFEVTPWWYIAITIGWHRNTDRNTPLELGGFGCHEECR